MCDMIPNAEHWRIALWEAQELQLSIMGYLPGFATPRLVCDVPYVGKRWVHQVARYDRTRGISYWSKNYRTGLEAMDVDALNRVYPFYDPIDSLPAAGQAWWGKNCHRPCGTAVSVGYESVVPVSDSSGGRVSSPDKPLALPATSIANASGSVRNGHGRTEP
jgi:lysine 2,3-aminomutase